MHAYKYALASTILSAQYSSDSLHCMYCTTQYNVIVEGEISSLTECNYWIDYI